MISGKTAIVTGASRGIGEEIAYKLASLGANVAVIYSGNEEAANKVAETIKEKYLVNAKAYKLDVASFDDAKSVIAKIKEDFGGVQILVNNAGVTRDGLLAMMKEEDFDKVVDTNLKGTFNMIRHTIPLFFRAKEGVIVNISSVSGILGNAGQANYSASKAGIIGLTKAVAREYATKNIRCNAVAPGFIQTAMTENLINEDLLKAIPIGKVGDTSDVADAVAYLVEAKYVTGEVLKVDGGMAI